MHLNVTIKNVSWSHFSWATLYNDDDDNDDKYIHEMVFASLFGQ